MSGPRSVAEQKVAEAARDDVVGLLAELVGHADKPADLDSWHDAANFTRAGTPTFSFGPDGIETAHAVNERVSVRGLVDFTAALAVTAMRWCRVTSSHGRAGRRIRHEGGGCGA